MQFGPLRRSHVTVLPSVVSGRKCSTTLLSLLKEALSFIASFIWALQSHYKDDTASWHQAVFSAQPFLSEGHENNQSISSSLVAITIINVQGDVIP